MNPALMFYPCLALLILTFLVMIKMFRGRQAAVRSGAVSAAYFKTYDTGETLPRAARQADRCYHNLLESAPPFYFISLALIALDRVDLAFLVLAWVYVLARVLQSIVHVGSNKIGPRAQLFGLAWLILIAMALRLGYLLA